MSSKRETLLAGIKTALERIDGTGSYNYTLTADTVQRTRHSLVDAEHIVNEFRTRPMILIKAGNGAADYTDTTGSVVRTLAVRIVFLFDGAAGCSEISDALEDISRALEAELVATSFGAGVRSMSAVDSSLEPEEGEPLDGAIAEFTFTYYTSLGDPASGG